MSKPYKLLLFFLSLAIVALGQPANFPYLGPITAICGFALFWRILLDFPAAKRRFLLGTVWYTSIILIQFSWMLTHPFKYIYFLYPLLALLLYGLQWGLICLYITPKHVTRPLFPLFIAAFWTCLELSRLFVLTGTSWNPAGLFLATNPYSLQMASWVGIYGMSFWVMLTNAVILQAFWINPSLRTWLCALCTCLFPYLLGISTFFYHDAKRQEAAPTLNILLVQTGFPIEEWLPQWSAQEAIELTLMEWQAILKQIAPYKGRAVDLLVLPENVVPFGARTPLFRHDLIVKLFTSTFGEQAERYLPTLSLPDARSVHMDAGEVWVVSHSYILQGIANWLHAGVVAGLEDRVVLEGRVQHTASAFYYIPHSTEVEKYDKQILVPGEYTPFAFLAPFLKEYGIHDSFAAGKAAKLFFCKGSAFGLSICYEEIYGNVMRANRLLGSEMLVNVTNDGWYPGPGLSQQHFSHALLRTVEMGIPLVRATNTGVTASVSSLGGIIDQIESLDTPGVLLTTVPLYHYTTLYTYIGDFGVFLLSALCLLAYFLPLNVLSLWKKRLFSKKPFYATD